MTTTDHGPRSDAGPAVEATGLHKTYGTTRAVDGIDLTVARGEVVALLGPNGAGKTTLIEMLLGLRSPDRGTVRLLDGTPGTAATRARVGAMLQEVDTPPSLSVREIVALVRRYYPRARSVDDVLARAGLDDDADARASTLSGGRRQRLSFALAIVGDPDLLFLDEPTAAMDVGARHAFWQQVRELSDAGTTVLLASHHMGEVEALAHRVVVVHRGRVVADGTPAHVARTVATRQVRVTVAREDAALVGLPGVVEVTTDPDDPDRHTLVTTDAEETVRTLFALDVPLSRLVVLDSDMETAFLHLVRDQERAA